MPSSSPIGKGKVFDFVEDRESEEIARKEGAHQTKSADFGRFLRGQVAIAK